MQTEPATVTAKKVSRTYKFKKALVDRVEEHAAQWRVSRTAIWETAVEEFFAVERNALQRK